jgi:hypothetical protein
MRLANDKDSMEAKDIIREENKHRGECKNRSSWLMKLERKAQKKVGKHQRRNKHK